MVAGPQLGYFYPEFFWEVDMEGGGVSVRGGSLAGIPNVLIGRGPDYGWSFTSSQSDNVDTFAETLCGDDHHYVYKGACTAMTRFDAGQHRRGRGGSTPVVFYETVHGPVIGYGTVAGKRVALAQERSTRGRELKAALDVYALSTGRLRSPQQFTHDLSRFEMSFNGFYVDCEAHRLRLDRPAAVCAPRASTRASRPSAPATTTGRASSRPARIRRRSTRASGAIVNWNNKPAPGFAAADDNFAYGPIHRSLLLAARRCKPGRTRCSTSSTSMNKAATQDLRAVEVWPPIVAALRGRPAPSARDAAAARSRHGVVARRAPRGSTANLDGKVDDPGAAILDAAWAKLADGVLAPGARPAHRPARRADGAATTRRTRAAPPTSTAGTATSSRTSGGARHSREGAVREPLLRRRRRDACSQGALGGARRGRRRARGGAGPRPGRWRADATKERIQFAPGFLPVTMRWANRPTYQQILCFGGHR